MRVSEILQRGVEQFLSLVPSIEGHMQSKENPHAVTKETVGLGNVSNVPQASQADFSAHRTAATLGHPDGSVSAAKLAKGAVTTEKLGSGAVTGAKLATGSVTETHLTPSLLETISSKVDSIKGKGLSQNDFTDALRQKLEAISVTDGSTNIDASTVISRTEPLYVRKTGAAFLESDSPHTIENVEKVLAFSPFPSNNISAVSYKKKDGSFGCTFFKDGVKLATYDGFSSAGTFGLSAEPGSSCFVAEAGSGVTVVSEVSASHASSTFSTLSLVPLSTFSSVDLRHVFVRKFGSDREVTTVYFSYAHDLLYVDCYIQHDSGDPDLKWKTTFACSVDSTMAASSDFFASNNRFACMDESGNLFLAIPNCTPEPYRIIKLDTDGNIIGRFHSLAIGGDTFWDYPRDILLHESKLYTLSPRGVACYDANTGSEKTMYTSVNSDRWTAKNLIVLPDGRPAFYAHRLGTDSGHLVVLLPHGEASFVDASASIPQYEIAGAPLLCQNAGTLSAKLEGLFLDPETGTVTSKYYDEYTEYAVR